VNRLVLRLADRHDWVKVFDPRGSSIFVGMESPPAVGEEVRIDLTIEDGGPRVILRGAVLWARTPEESDEKDPPGCSVGLVMADREKVNFLNGYVRGGLLNRRERRRLPLRLSVTYGGLAGPEQTFTRDINEEGMFILAEEPLPEQTLLHFILAVPGRAEPVELKGTVSHTVIPSDDDVPGMGVRYVLDDPARAATMKGIVDQLEQDFLAGTLPDDVIS
jgi:Tfp pilus assembly protein PilZ